MKGEITEMNTGFDYPEKFEEFLKPHRYKVAEGGRGGAKSHFFANNGVQEVFLRGKRMLCCREVQVSIKESVRALIVDKIEAQGLGRYFQIKESEILCPHNGGKISFAGLRQQGQERSAADNLKSYEGYDICWVEEAQTVSKMSLDVLLPTIRKDGSECWFSYNRKSESEPVHDRFVNTEFAPDDTVHIYVNWWDNPWFKDSPLYALMQSDRKNSPDDYRHIWCGLPRTFSKANLINNWEVREFEYDRYAKFHAGADWGFSPDPCTLIKSWPNWDTREIFVWDCLIKAELDPEQIDTQFFSLIPGIKTIEIIADNARPELIAFLKKKGYRIKSCRKGPGSIEAGLSWLSHWKIVIHPRCLKNKMNRMKSDITDEFKNYKRKIDPATGEPTSDIIDKHNHAIDALRYSYEREIMHKNSVDYLKLMQATVPPVAPTLVPRQEIVIATPEKMSLMLPNGKIIEK